MDYRQAIAYFKKHKAMTIMVTGPQRAGTRIAAKILAAELEFEYVDEMNHNVANWQKFLDSVKPKVVIQAPALCFKCEEVPKDVYVVFMNRRTEEILASQKRINWNGGKLERKHYSDKFGEFQHAVCIRKREIWVNTQRRLLSDRAVEIEYNSLSNHHMFLPAAKRKAFRWNQTK